MNSRSDWNDLRRTHHRALGGGAKGVSSRCWCILARGGWITRFSVECREKDRSPEGATGVSPVLCSRAKPDANHLLLYAWSVEQAVELHGRFGTGETPVAPYGSICSTSRSRQLAEQASQACLHRAVCRRLYGPTTLGQLKNDSRQVLELANSIKDIHPFYFDSHVSVSWEDCTKDRAIIGV